MLLKKVMLTNCKKSHLIKTFATLEEDEDEKIFVSQQQVDYEKERRFLRDGKN